MKFRSSHVLFLVMILSLFSSCVSREKIVYFQDIEKLAEKSSIAQPSLTFKSNDLIGIMVSASTLEAARPFNVIIEARPMPGAFDYGNTQLQQVGYVVDPMGNINFPELGEIKVEGMTPKELNEYLTKELSDYIKDPIVNIRLLNFTVSVLGEVNRPGTYPVTGEKISITEAVGLAGDLSIYGKRNNVLVIRENGDSKSYAYLDFTSAELMNSEYYYLKQNDVVYVEPNNAQRQSAAFNRNAGVYVSIASLLLSVVVLITR
ncbi:polysaccharide export protein [Aequorivita sp. H23M31]|uniref:Polysaccharide export protein n=1 Tax=Aequorivita ciconiae TaxID=2494375 RepID=A0A410G6T4_9FLAO|nr:polysaccharide biosynthesis/export family protein [Aequorivita sp. H23M31]QAA83008.1 polysaccharide export protein [Aequorivita sp. H23M31]